MKIYLIGMPGSGKTTAGKKLAENLKLKFIDLDAEIEKKESKTVEKIFAEKGENHFRLTESILLRNFAASPDDFVLATGGGAPCFYDGIEVINDSGTSVFLDVPIAELLKRVEVDNNRPLLLSTGQKELEEKLKFIRNTRLRFYEKAKFTVTHSDAENILAQLKLKK